MGFREFAVKSDKLADAIDALETDYDPSEIVDSYCTAGYDNDDSTGQEIFEEGLALALTSADYAKTCQNNETVTIFRARSKDGSVCYYQFGKDEDDAIRRLKAEAGQ